MSEKQVGKILSHFDGLGVASPEMVEERSLEIAKTDGRRTPNEADRILAKGELTGTVDPQTPEASPEVEAIIEWDKSPDASGTRAPAITPADEASVAETLVNEGLEEADHDVRLSAAGEGTIEEEE